MTLPPEHEERKYLLQSPSQELQYPDEQKDSTEWHKIVAFREVAKIIADYVKKGSRIYIEGSLKTRKYSDKNGVEKYTTEIVASQILLLSSDNAESKQQQGHQLEIQPQQTQQITQEQFNNTQTVADAEDIPF